MVHIFMSKTLNQIIFFGPSPLLRKKLNTIILELVKLLITINN